MSPILIVMATAAAMAMPAVALCLMKMKEVFYSIPENPDWESEKNFWLTLFGCAILLVLVVVGVEKASFGIMGELLTDRVRR
jgi:ATP-binding cassette, subfamily B (MDR/TAP), member 1